MITSQRRYPSDNERKSKVIVYWPDSPTGNIYIKRDKIADRTSMWVSYFYVIYGILPQYAGDEETATFVVILDQAATVRLWANRHVETTSPRMHLSFQPFDKRQRRLAFHSITACS